MRIIYSLLILSTLFSRVYCDFEIEKSIIEKAEKSSVTIETKVSESAYLQKGSWSGTGFVQNKEKGIIITNAHVVGPSSVRKCKVTFHDGKQIESKVLYYDSWQDFAVLKVDSSEIPQTVNSLTFSKSLPKQNDFVFVLGNNEGKGFSFHTGYISSLYDINGALPQHSYTINLNTVGGSSGSPVINREGLVVALNYGGSTTYALALNAEYIKYTLNSLDKNSKAPKRMHTGVIAHLYSLDKAVKHRKFDPKLLKEYNEKFPDARSRILTVARAIKKSPADSILKSGDIIWKINDKQVGPNLFEMDEIMNNSDKDHVSFTIFRDGKLQEKKVELYDVNKKKINTLVNFGGATFFTANEIVSSMTGIPMDDIAVVQIKNGSSFSSLPFALTPPSGGTHHRLRVNKLNNSKIKNLKDLQKVISELKDKQYITIGFKNYQAFFVWNGFLNTSHQKVTFDVELDTISDTMEVFKFNDKSLDWEKSK
jgi:S1-C subfamily serine protease